MFVLNHWRTFVDWERMPVSKRTCLETNDLRQRVEALLEGQGDPKFFFDDDERNFRGGHSWFRRGLKRRVQDGCRHEPWLP